MPFLLSALLPPDVAAAFVVAAVLLAIAPGPDNIFVLTQSALFGTRAGLITILGLCTGLVGHTLAVALGVAAVFQASPLAFMALKIFGAAYLLYLAWLTFRSGGTHTSLEQRPFPGYGALYRRGALMSSTNPKVMLFFLALLPQFASPERGALPWQIVQLGILFMVSSAAVFSVIAVLGGRLALWLNRSPQWQVLMNRTAALVFAGLAAMLLAT